MRRMEVDHKVPRSEGGSDALDNLRASCIPCNRHLAGKGTNSPARYATRAW